MKITKFLFPHALKLVLFIVLFTGTYYLSTNLNSIDGGASHNGFPFAFLQESGCYGPPGADSYRCWETELVSYPALAADVVLWYLAACTLYLAYEKLRDR